ncbi:MAG: mechanosensitive ion channel family protein [Bacillaceae bacterium]|nr:mechanosensitive ion channel family protein [Bacillaceae bacterium]
MPVFVTETTKFLSEWFENPIFQLITGAIITVLAVYIIKRLVQSFFRRTDFLEERKEQTLESMINSIVRYTATFGFIIYTLMVFGAPVTQVLAGAGILGVVLGLGAQSIIRDMLSGVFLLYEKQLHKGDFVSVNNTFNGTVEDIGLRFLKIREWSGKLLTISNGEIKTIQNYNIEKMRVIENVTTSFYEDPKKVFATLEVACRRMNNELDTYLKRNPAGESIEPFQVYGMTSLNNDFRGYQYTVIGLVDDQVYWTAAKRVRQILAETLYEHQIEMAEQHIEIKSAPGRQPE